MKTVVARTAGHWRRWLEKHHRTETEVWLVFFKRHTGQASVAYDEAVDEALCFGWVDSLIKRLDDSRYARKFTPRRAGSRWSSTNRRRHAALKASRKLAPAGLSRSPGHLGSAAPPPMPARLPAYIASALKNRPRAQRVFDALPPSHRTTYVRWIDSAKREDTKARRLREAIRLLEAGKSLGLK